MRHRHRLSAQWDAGLRRLSTLTWRATLLSAVGVVGFMNLFNHAAATTTAQSTKPSPGSRAGSQADAAAQASPTPSPSSTSTQGHNKANRGASPRAARSTHARPTAQPTPAHSSRRQSPSRPRGHPSRARPLPRRTRRQAARQVEGDQFIRPNHAGAVSATTLGRRVSRRSHLRRREYGEHGLDHPRPGRAGVVGAPQPAGQACPAGRPGCDNGGMAAVNSFQHGPFLWYATRAAGFITLLLLTARAKLTRTWSSARLSGSRQAEEGTRIPPLMPQRGGASAPALLDVPGSPWSPWGSRPAGGPRDHRGLPPGLRSEGSPWGSRPAAGPRITVGLPPRCRSEDHL